MERAIEQGYLLYNSPDSLAFNTVGKSGSWLKKYVKITKSKFFILKKVQDTLTSGIDNNTIVATWKGGDDFKIFTTDQTYHFKIGEKELSKEKRLQSWVNAFSVHTENYKLKTKLEDEITSLKDELKNAQTASFKSAQGIATIQQWADIGLSVNQELLNWEFIPLKYKTMIQNATEPMDIRQYKHKINTAIDAALYKYQHMFYKEVSDDSHIVPCGFREFSSVVELMLRGRCSGLEAQAAGNFRELNAVDASKQRIADLSRSSQILRCQGTTTTLSEGRELKEKPKTLDRDAIVKNKMQSIQSCLLQCSGGKLTSLQAKEMTEIVCNHLTSTTANYACKTAVQLCFGVDGLIMIKPSQNVLDITEPGTIDITEHGVKVEVPSCWWAVEDNTFFWCLERDMDPGQYWGSVDANYIFSWSYDDFNDGHPYHTYITVQRKADSRKNDNSPVFTQKANVKRKLSRKLVKNKAVD